MAAAATSKSVKESSKVAATDKEPASKVASVKDATSKASVKASNSEKEALVPKNAFKNPFENQCGLENDGSPWFDSTPLPRIKITEASTEQQAFYQRIIDACTKPETIYGIRVDFDPNDVMEVVIQVQTYLASEGTLIEDVPFDVVVVGDLHGQLHDLDRIFRTFARDGKPGYLCKKFLFMGDYVDRGHQSLEILMLLFSLKILYPDNFFLLRGNHEFLRINKGYGFKREIDDRYLDPTATIIFDQFNETFCWMSICAIVGDTYFCSHAGIPARGCNREELRGLGKPIVHSSDDVLVQDMIWTDPAIGLKGTSFNYDRGTSHFYGQDVIVNALQNIGCMAQIRGHSRMDEGHEKCLGVVHTVFSASGQSGTNNKAAAAHVNEKGQLKVYIFKPDLERIKTDAKLVPKVKKGKEEAAGAGKTVQQPTV